MIRNLLHMTSPGALHRSTSAGATPIVSTPGTATGGNLTGTIGNTTSSPGSTTGVVTSAGVTTIGTAGFTPTNSMGLTPLNATGSTPVNSIGNLTATNLNLFTSTVVGETLTPGSLNLVM